MRSPEQTTGKVFAGPVQKSIKDRGAASSVLSKIFSLLDWKLKSLVIMYACVGGVGAMLGVLCETFHVPPGLSVSVVTLWLILGVVLFIEPRRYT